MLIAALLGLHYGNAQHKTVEVGGAAMSSSKNIVEHAVNSKDHTTVVAAMKAAGLLKTLESSGHSLFLRLQIRLSKCYQKRNCRLYSSQPTSRWQVRRQYALFEVLNLYV